MEPEEVLDLIRSAPEHYDSVRAASRYRGDDPTHKQIRERIASTEAGRRAFNVSPQDALEAGARVRTSMGLFGDRCN